MGRLTALLGFGLVCAMAGAQGGGGAPGAGGFGGGGFGGGGGRGSQQSTREESVRQIEESIRTYFNGEEIKNILTPGEFSEWPLTLKAGQVIVAEARSDAFDPALEVVGGGDKVLATNDDRYPGDQRPLLLWHCDKDGSYLLRGRCFRNKAGGQFFLRFKIFDSVDLGDKFADATFEDGDRLMLRVPMRAGQIKQISFDWPDVNYTTPSIRRTVSPIGLPDAELATKIESAIGNSIVAPVDGDYYVTLNLDGPVKIRARAVDVQPAVFERTAGAGIGSAPKGMPFVWSVTVKAGEILEASTPNLEYSSRLVVVEQPDFQKFDLKVPESNPFYPKSETGPPEKPAVEDLHASNRDSRVQVFTARRDVKLWIASSGNGPRDRAYEMRLGPASKVFEDGRQIDSSLDIGRTEHWTYDAKVGDVLSFKFGSKGFSVDATIRDPDLLPIWRRAALPGQGEVSGNFVVKKPGRYIVAVGCYGGGGSGPYTMTRNVLSAKALSKDKAATFDESAGPVQVWKFTVKPDEPLLMHLKSKDWAFALTMTDESGEEVVLSTFEADSVNRYGYVKVTKPTTYLLVLISNPGAAPYSLELNDLPGYKKGQ